MAQLSMKVLLQLQAKQFKAGIKEVNKAFNSIKSTMMGVAGAIAGGIGLGKIVSEIKDTTVQLSVAQATLRNVSEGTAEYADNMRFLKKIADDYGQSVLALTQSFAQFRAAAKASNLTLEDQRDIFEALTRAAGAYHLSSDQTKLSMMAVTQMMSKGKVTSEELRRQLGNNLPGAFNIMATAAGAAGITTNGTTAELEEMMKKGKVLADEVLPAFAKQLNIVTAGADFDSLQSSINRFQNAWVTFVENGGFEDFYQKLVDTSTKILEKIGQDVKGFINTLVAVGASIVSIPLFKNLTKMGEEVTKGMKTKAEALKQTADTARQSCDNLKNSVEQAVAAAYKHEGFIVDEKGNVHALTKEAQKYYVTQMKNLEAGKHRNKELQNMYNTAKESAHEVSNGYTKAGKTLDAANEKIGVLGKSARGVTGIFSSMWNVLKANAAYLAISAIIGILTKLVTTIVANIKEYNRLKNLSEEHMKSIEKVSDATLIQTRRVNDLAKVATDLSKDDNTRLTAIEQLNKELGRTGKKAWNLKTPIDQINSTIEDWTTNILKAAKALAAFEKLKELQQRNIEIELENEKLRDKAKETKKTNMPAYGFDDFIYPGKDQTGTREYSTPAALKAQGKLDKNNLELAQNTDAIDKLNQMIQDEGLTPYLNNSNGGNGGSGGGGGNGSGDSVKDPVKSAIENYQKQSEALKNRLMENTISTEEYESEMNKLIDKTWEAITSVSGFREALEKLGVDASGIEGGYKTNRLFEKYGEEAKQMAQLHTPMPELGVRDTSKDWKKTAEEIQQEELDIKVKFVADLENFQKELQGAVDAGDFSSLSIEEVNAVLDKLAEKLENAKNQANSLDAALTLQKAKKSLVELQKEYNDSQLNAVTSVADGMDRLYRSIQSVSEAFGEKIEWEGFEKFMSILNMSIQTMQTIMSIIDGIKKAEEAYMAIKKASTAVEVASDMKAAASAGVKASAEGAAAAAGAAESQAAIPVVGPALAVAAVAAVVGAIIAGMSKFAKGGIVGGNSYSGDNNMVRANTGEMILTRAQQATLFNAINSGRLGGGDVEFKIRGADLVGTINNYEHRKRG